MEHSSRCSAVPVPSRTRSPIGSADRRGDHEPEHGLGTINDKGDQFSTTVDQLQQLVSGLAQDRGPIGEAIPQIADATGSLAVCCRAPRPDIQAMIEQTNRTANQLVLGQDDIDKSLSRLPTDYKKLIRVGSYGDFFQFSPVPEHLQVHRVRRIDGCSADGGTDHGEVCKSRMSPHRERIWCGSASSAWRFPLRSCWRHCSTTNSSSSPVECGTRQPLGSGRSDRRRQCHRRRRRRRQGRQGRTGRTAGTRDLHGLGGHRAGRRHRRDIKTNTVLGKKSLAVAPEGSGTLRVGETIPIERTNSPYSLTDALGDLGARSRSWTPISSTSLSTRSPVRCRTPRPNSGRRSTASRACRRASTSGTRACSSC